MPLCRWCLFRCRLLPPLYCQPSLLIISAGCRHYCHCWWPCWYATISDAAADDELIFNITLLLLITLPLLPLAAMPCHFLHCIYAITLLILAIDGRFSLHYFTITWWYASQPITLLMMLRRQPLPPSFDIFSFLRHHFHYDGISLLSIATLLMLLPHYW